MAVSPHMALMISAAMRCASADLSAPVMEEVIAFPWSARNVWKLFVTVVPFSYFGLVFEYVRMTPRMSVT